MCYFKNKCNCSDFFVDEMIYWVVVNVGKVCGWGNIDVVMLS